jgi:hypothetical protein
MFFEKCPGFFEKSETLFDLIFRMAKRQFYGFYRFHRPAAPFLFDPTQRLHQGMLAEKAISVHRPGRGFFIT